MSLIQAKCTNCGANIKVDDTKEAGVCEACGTAFITEKVIQNYNVTTNTTNIAGDNVTVNVYSKNIDALVEHGLQIIRGKSYFYEPDIAELKRLSKELMDIQENSYYGKLFSFASGFGLKDDNIEYSLIFDLLKESCPQNIQTLAKNIIVGYLKINKTTFAQTTDSNNIGITLMNLSGLGNLSTLGLVNTLEGFKNYFNSDELEVISNAKNGYVDFIEKCFEHFEEEISLFYFSEVSLKEFNFTNVLSKKLISLIMLEIRAKDLLLENCKVIELGKKIGATINSNAKIIGTNLIYGKSFLQNADESIIIDFKLNKEDVCVSFNIYSDKVVLGEDKITIGNNRYKVEINVVDILFINQSCAIPGTFFYDIVYKVNPEAITCYRLICSTADKGSDKITTWFITKGIKDSHDENWGLKLPIEEGLNKYKYIASNCFLSTDGSNEKDIICFYPSGVCFYSTQHYPSKLYLRYDNIANVDLSDTSKNRQYLQIRMKGKLSFEIFYELKNNNSKFNKVKEILTERAEIEAITYKQGCYVATCVYGSYDCPEVWTLRRYRDNTLASTWYGRAFIRTYYAISPTLVKWFGKTKWFKKMWKGKLDRMVKKLQNQGVENTPYADKDWK